MEANRRQFAREFKTEAIRLVMEERRPLAQVARELGPDYRAPAEYEQAACISRAAYTA